MTENEVTDALVQAQAGDEEAARQLFHYMYPHATRLVYANLPRRESAEDLVQQVCIKAMASLHQYSGQVPFLHWISRIAINTCLNQMRHEKRRPEVRYADLSEDEAAALEHFSTASGERDAGELMAASELVEKLLAILSPADQILMRLFYLEGHSVEEIAARTGWGKSMIKIRPFRARILLRKRYDHLAQEKP